MNIESVVQLLAGEVAKNPQMLTSLLNHPYSTIGNATNNNNVSKEEASQVVAAMSQLAGGQRARTGEFPARLRQHAGRERLQRPRCRQDRG